MKFKELELEKEGSWLKRSIRSRQFIRTVRAVLIGAVAGFLYYYFTEGLHMDPIPAGDILKSIAIGGFFGFFITNSPCARGGAENILYIYPLTILIRLNHIRIVIMIRADNGSQIIL